MRLIKENIKAGIDVRFLMHYEATREDVYRKWRDAGVRIRFYESNEKRGIRFSTFDGKIARITIGKPEIEREEDYLSFWIESPALAIMLKEQFLASWNKAKE